ncbi:F0F1 ATP synthase subunit delta [Georgenia sp. 311]|uniref:ATP synthase subunit delta n=1 Tax=Georgenia wutianyii TaxID=2585135 RepID=A0ABX5VNL8_9MICO|nr:MULTISPECIES: F0F1 ATP synthase subunit delta [Georgenia]QDB80057.1 F0F1 ATP synthase subunit delta [Georgenia wutianyii]TNC17359.1 F0F1 ATP synthase subunit delta [Georgenia sp. 311]
MRASSQAALSAASERWEVSLREAGERGRELGSQLYEVADALAGSGSLRRALTDPGRTGDAKARLVGALFDGKVAPEVVDLLAGMVRSRWSREEDLGLAVEELAAASVLSAAQSRDALLEVEEELFHTERLLASSRELRAALAERDVDPQRRAALLDSLIAAASPETRLLVHRMVTTPWAGSLISALRHVGELAAARRDRLVAGVTAAAPLTQEQEARLGRILEGAYGRSVQINVGVDPAVIGGMRIQVGAEVIDGTTLARLQDARRRFAG